MYMYVYKYVYIYICMYNMCIPLGMIYDGLHSVVDLWGLLDARGAHLRHPDPCRHAKDPFDVARSPEFGQPGVYDI